MHKLGKAMPIYHSEGILGQPAKVGLLLQTYVTKAIGLAQSSLNPLDNQFDNT